VRVPVEWLREYVNVGLKSDTLADRLTMAGSEVSALEFHGKGIEGVVVGKVKVINPHPSNEDLLILQIDIATKLVQIVTNVKSLKAGDKVPIAVHGAKLAKDIHVEVRDLHGVESFGMLCSLEHLGLAEESFEVMKLDKDAPLGENIKNVLGVKGTILEVDVLPNRGDLLSIVGVAREVSAILGNQLKPPKVALKEGKGNISSRIKVEVKDSDLCPRYMARVIDGVKIGESPSWMKERLIACGLRPINNIVDITNYVLLEMGQPLHAFDLAKIKGAKIVVRRSRKGEGIKTLDGEKRALSADTLVIADEKRPLAIAGVMGGQETEVDDGTAAILLEAAYFKPTSINKTSRQVKLRTDSSTRFERGVDWQGVAKALDRAAQLIAEHAGGEVLRGVIDVKKKAVKPKALTLRMDVLDRTLGLSLPAKKTASILKGLGFKASSSGKNLKVEVPTFRAGDIEREIDVIEEIARIYGYDKIKSSMPTVTHARSQADKIDSYLDRALSVIKGYGFFETQTFSIVSPKEIKRLEIPEGDQRGNPLRISNPLSEEISALRTLLFPSVLSVISRNSARQLKDSALFELGKVFLKGSKKLPAERLKLALAVTGNVFMGSFKVGGVESPNYYILKAALESLLEELGVANYSFTSKQILFLEEGISAVVKIGDVEIGFIGELSSGLGSKYDLINPVYIAEIDLEPVLKAVSADRRYKPLAKFPKVSRDIAMFVPQDVEHGAIVEIIESRGAPILEKVRLFDRYSGKQVPNGYFSLAYRVDYRDPTKTLTDKEVNQKHDQVLKALSEVLNVQIRQ
jgi:phenylalanyl-tRNA synthetase beta chain